MQLSALSAAVWASRRRSGRRVAGDLDLGSWMRTRTTRDASHSSAVHEKASSPTSVTRSLAQLSIRSVTISRPTTTSRCCSDLSRRTSPESTRTYFLLWTVAASMGVLDRLKRLAGSVDGPVGAKSSPYPVYDGDFWNSITWACNRCGGEFYWLDDDRQLTCHHCDTTYSLREGDFPEPLRAKCWNCGKITDKVSGFRAENVRFDCPHCAFEWESSEY